MRIIDSFKKALLDMRDKGELDKILKYYDEDREHVENDIEVINRLAEAGADNVSIWPILMELESVNVLKNALCFMLNNEIEESTLEIGDDN